MIVEYIVKKEIKDIPKSAVFKGHTAIEVPCVTTELDADTQVIKPYEWIKPEGEGYFRMSTWEFGGADKVSGVAEIVCGPAGEKLKPVRINRRASETNKQHALFVGKWLVIIKVQQQRDMFELNITEYTMNPSDGITTVKSLFNEKLGQIDNVDIYLDETLGESLLIFKNAMKAAMHKAKLYNCKEPIFFTDESKA
jgi:hypothetical protein